MLGAITKNDHINYESFFAVFVSTAFWRIGYRVLRFLLPGKNPEYCCRLITLVHGLMVAFIGINQCFLIDSPFNHPEWRTSYIQSFLMVASLGYFVHDLAWIYQHQSGEKLMMAHHFYSVCALFRMLFKGYSGAQATCALGSMEITNPFLQARWFIRSEGMYPSILFTSVETSFVIVFVAVRIVLGSYYMTIIIQQPKNDWDFILLAMVIYVMSWVFLLNIIKYVVIKYGGLKRKLDDLHNKGS